MLAEDELLADAPSPALGMNHDTGLGRIGPGAVDVPALARGIAGDRRGCVGGGKREGARAKDSCSRQFDGYLHFCFSAVLESWNVRATPFARASSPVRPKPLAPANDSGKEATMPPPSRSIRHYSL